MLSVLVVGLLVGLAVPIVLVITAIIADALALMWFASRTWHDEWSPLVIRFAERKSQFLRGHGFHWHRPAHR